jgi:hypothetical protein
MAQRKNLNISPLQFLGFEVIIITFYHHHHHHNYLGFYVLALTGGRYVMILTDLLLSHVIH